MISFSDATIAYDRHYALFRFTGWDGPKKVSFSMSHAIFEEVSGQRIDPDSALMSFIGIEAAVFEIAQRKYAALTRPTESTVQLTLSDIRAPAQS